MKAKKILFTTSGVLKIVISAIALVLFLLVLLLSGIFIDSLITGEDVIAKLVEGLAEEDANYYLSMDVNQFKDYLSSTIGGFCGIVIFFSVAGITFGIFNLIFAKKYYRMLMGKKGKKIIFMICSLVFYPGIITNILTIIALFLKDTIGIAKSDGGKNDSKIEVNV